MSFSYVNLLSFLRTLRYFRLSFGSNTLTAFGTRQSLIGNITKSDYFIFICVYLFNAPLKPYFTIGVKFNNLIKHDKLNDMMLTLPQIDEELLSKITCPAYIVAGESDIMWLSDTVFIHESIPGSKIAIIEGAKHSSYMSRDGKQAYVLAHDFFGSLSSD